MSSSTSHITKITKGSLAIKNGKVFFDGMFQTADLIIEDGIITSISTNSTSSTSNSSRLKADEQIDASGLLVLPGLIDPHVHLREPGDTYKEDFVTGSRAAIAGGFTTVMDMPNNKVPTITKERLEQKISIARNNPKVLCDIFFHFGGTDDNFDEVTKANPHSLKLYLGHTTGNLALKNSVSMEKHFVNFPKNRPIVLHACDHSNDEENNLKVTYSTIERAVCLAEKMKRRVHIAHASTGKEIRLAKSYHGCTVEVAPHYLFLNSGVSERLGKLAKVFPPLRSEQKRIGLWSALQLADCIATDHAPHTIEDKEAGAAGFPGLETSLALMLHGCDLGLINRIWVVQKMSESVADAFNLSKRGRIREGFIGDIAIVDPKKEWIVDSSRMESKCKWSPFEGMKLKGKVHTVIKDGQIIYKEYKFLQ